jgi:hypothetical protein
VAGNVQLCKAHTDMLWQVHPFESFSDQWESHRGGYGALRWSIGTILYGKESRSRILAQHTADGPRASKQDTCRAASAKT